MSVVISLVYYGSYTAAMLYYAASGIDTLFPGVQILIILLSTVYLCQYLLVIEKRKISQEDAVADLLNEKVSLTNELSSKNEELEEAYWDMVNTLIDVIAAKDNFTGGHSIKVCEYSILLAQKLELSKSDLTKILKASILHDIGKMGIPDSILLKPDALSDDEYGRIKSHPEIGCRILTRVKGLEDILPMILSHHERVDGKGYPNGLVSESIPEGAKIIAIADAYDAMTSNRPYRKALAKKEARKRLLEGAGTQFDAEYVEKFIEVIDSDNIERLDDYRKKDIRKIKEYAGIM
jgi:putative nucleotidyltransferase with HDIG domain